MSIIIKHIKGNTYPGAVLAGGGTCMDSDDCGMIVKVFFDRPTESEVRQFDSGSAFEMRLVQMRNIIFGLFKIGNLNWIDTPYNVHLSRNLTKRLEVPADGEGIAAVFQLYDPSTGRLCNSRLIGLSTEISREFIRMAEEQYKNSFNREAYLAGLANIYAAYRTSDLVRMSLHSCSFRLHQV